MAGFTETMIIAMKVHIMAEPNYYRNSEWNDLWSSTSYIDLYLTTMKNKLEFHPFKSRPFPICVGEWSLTNEYSEGQIKMPQRFGDIMMSISKLTFTANPDYAGFYKILQEIIKDENVRITVSHMMMKSPFADRYDLVSWLDRKNDACGRWEGEIQGKKEIKDQGSKINRTTSLQASARAMDESLTQRRKKLEEEMVQVRNRSIAESGNVFWNPVPDALLTFAQFSSTRTLASRGH